MPEGAPDGEASGPERKEDSGDRVIFIETRSKIPKEFFISYEDAEKYGRTRGCPGCRSWDEGRST